MTWLLLIYTVPAQPSRKRAAVWRDLKRAGAVYLRDGVCALPEREQMSVIFQDIAAKVEEFGGQATLARAVELDNARSQAILAEATAARAEEYADLAQEIQRFLFHIHEESKRRGFSFSELERLEADLGKLWRWHSQIAARDFGPHAGDSEAAKILAQCEAELGSYLEETFKREEATH